LSSTFVIVDHFCAVDPNAVTDTNHDTALTLACAGGHGELVRILLAHQAHIEHRDKKGLSIILMKYKHNYLNSG